jgi:hypothetical protein
MLNRTIVEGLLIGASGSVVATALLGLSGWLRRRWLRIEQIRFLRRLLCDALSILNTRMPQDILTDTGKILASGEAIRTTVLDKLSKDVQAAIRERCRDMTYDQLYALWQPFDVFYYQLAKANNRAPGEILCKKIYDELARIKWLKIDPWEAQGKNKCKPAKLAIRA